MEKKLTAFDLKLIGIFFMVLDHIHEMWAFDGAPMWLTMLGRIVAPIFLYLSAEGFHYTKSRWGYFRNLLLGFWMMNLITFLLPKWLPNEHVVLINNIFGTLLLGILLMWGYDLLKKGIKQHSSKQIIIGIALFLAILLYSILIPLLMSTGKHISLMLVLFNLFPSILTTEGSFVAVFLALFFYIFREKKVLQYLSLVVAAFISTGFHFSSLFSHNIQWMMVFALIPLYFYNGKEGKKMKGFFYIFYPLHIVLLYILATLL